MPVSTLGTSSSMIQGASATGEHAVPVLDRTGWHLAKGFDIPSTVTLVWLPPYSPQLERFWLILRALHPGQRLLDAHDAVVGTLCCAWSALVASPAVSTWNRSRYSQDGMTSLGTIATEALRGEAGTGRAVIRRVRACLQRDCSQSRIMPMITMARVLAARFS
jgi:hypothetical protein